MERSVLHDAHNKIKLVHVCSKPNIGSLQIMKLCKHFDKYGLNIKLMTKLKTRHSYFVSSQSSGT